MTAVLTPTQMFLLRRIADGVGVPAHLRGESMCALDLERLCARGLLDWVDGELLTTAEGSTYLEGTDFPREGECFGGMRVIHGRDHSITVEYRPAQE